MSLFRNGFTPFALIVLLAVPAHATTLSWKAATSGLASTAANWSPAQAPTSTDDTIFNVAGTYTVTWNGVTASLSQTYKKGTVTYTSTDAHTIGGLFRVGDVSGDAATLTITNGTINANTAFSVGNASGSTGSLNVQGPTAQILTPNTSDMTVGPGGTGTVSLSNGGRVSIANFSALGSQATGNGNLIVAGVSPGLVRSQFNTGVPSPGTFSIGVSGHGTLSVDNGGLATATNKVAIASGSGSVGSVLVGGVNGSFASALQVTGTLDVAVAPGAPAAGTGSLRVYNGGQVDVSGLTTVGDPNGGTGTLRVESNSRFTSGGLLFDPAHGVLDFQGGTIEVKGGTFDPPGTTMDLVGGSRHVILSNGASATFTNSPLNAYSLIVGETGAADFDVLSGSTLTTSATTAVGLGAGSVGTMRVEGAGSTWGESAASQIFFGVGGSGNLSVAGGGHITADALTTGYLSGSSAMLDLTGAGSRVDAGAITLGGTGTTPGGSTYVIVTNGATLASNGDAVGIRVLSPAQLVVDQGGRVETLFAMENFGLVAMGGGVVEAPSFTLGGTGAVSGHGTVHGVFTATDTTTLITASGGVLELGDSTQSSAFVMLGSLKVGSAQVRLRSRTSVSLPRCTIGGGRLELGAGGGAVPAGRSLTGAGTIAGRLVNGGSLIASSPGLTIEDTLLCSNNPMTGVKFTFGPGSLFLGFGAIGSDAIDAQAGSTIQTNGSLVLGKNAATTSVTLAGRLFVSGNATVTVNHLSSTAPCPLGTLTRLNAGSQLLRANGFILAAGDTLEGHGTIQGPLTNNGVVSPGIEPASNTHFGTLHVNGNYSNVGSKVVVQIGDAPTNMFDQLAITGTATLGGTLDVRLPEGFAPSPGESFTVMTFGSRTGTFAAVTFQGYPPGAAITVTYNATSVVVTAGTIPVGVEPPAPPASLAFSGASGEHAAFTIALPEAARVRIALYSAAGRRVGVLCDRDLPAGVMRFPVERGAGVWFARAEIVTPLGRATRAARVTSLR